MLTFGGWCWLAVVLVVCVGGWDVSDRCLEMGMSDYMSKPVTKSDLLRVLATAPRLPVNIAALAAANAEKAAAAADTDAAPIVSSRSSSSAAPSPDLLIPRP